MSEERKPAQEIPGKERYTYPGSFIQLLFVWLGVLLGPVLIGSGIYTLGKGGWFLIPMGVLWAWFAIGTWKFAFERNRPLEIGENAVSAMAFGRVWKSISWQEVQRIEKIRTTIYTQLLARDGYAFVIVGANDQIRLDDTIRKLPGYEKYPAILDSLNRYVQRYNIPLVAYDRGEDTRAHIKATVKDRRERRKLLKEGVRSSISAL